ncbi:hypothetical protein POKO110462_15555 [Pontibacter korlensis]|uniref:Lipoprotein n=1 Tax=Pontibacter korlensis TaxID=400092 RepID=A0A0E3ZCH6_9BACT|nr:hypothetical protein [Pontibacter korlensis]AKD01853.1 hypothetical protein PKOR_00165 [Pontibacter korlensis]
MKSKLYLLVLPLCLLACSPQNEEVQDEHVAVGPPAKALDTIAPPPKDAVLTDENDTSPTLPLPPPVMRLLAEKYPGWEKPQIAADALQEAKEHTNSPAVARGDFDGDTRQDVALQLQQGEEIVIVAALQPQEENYKLVELKRDILFNDRGNLSSLYYLYRLAQGENLQNMETNKEFELPHDAVAVGVGGDVTVYHYQNGSFQSMAVP